MELPHKLRSVSWPSKVTRRLLASVASAAIVFPSLSIAAEKPAWTILIYANGDHNLSPALAIDFLEMQKCGSTKDFNIIVQTDFQKNNEETYEYGLPSRFGGGTTRWLVTKSESKQIESKVLSRLPEIDSDQTKRLTEFIRWGMREFPADRYGLILWDHGGSWTGFGGDSQNGNRKHVSPMKLNAIQAGIEAGLDNRVEKLDFLSFDACLMANQEVITQVSHLAHLYIACGEIDYGEGWDYHAALAWLKQHADCKIEDFGKAEVRLYEKHHQTLADRYFMSHSAFDTSRADTFTKEAARFAAALRIRYNRHAARAQRDATPYLVLGFTDEENKVNAFFDLDQMAESLASNKEVSSSLRAAASRVVRASRAMRIANTSGRQKEGSGGINVFLPYRKPYRASMALSRFEKVHADSIIEWSRVVYAARKARSAVKNLPQIVVTEGSNSSSFNVRVKAGEGYLITSDVVQIVRGDIFDLGEAGTVILDGTRNIDLRWDRKLPCVRYNGKRVFLAAFSAPSGPAMVADVLFIPPKGEKPFDGTVAMSVSPHGKLEFIEAIGSPDGGSPRAFEVEPGTVVIPYVQKIGASEVKKVLTGRAFVVPRQGLEHLPVALEELEPGEYFLAIQAEDSFGNSSNIEFKPVTIR